MTSELVRTLRNPRTIRERAHSVLELGRRGGLTSFLLHEECLEEVARFVVQEVRTNYPDLRVPYHSRWGHFNADGHDRLAALRVRWNELSPEEAASEKFLLIVTSVLLDAGSGPEWRFFDAETKATIRRSEGLAVASLRMFEAGAFRDLRRVSDQDLEAGFQVSQNNPLVGVPGRSKLIRMLGETLPPADLFLEIRDASTGREISAAEVFRVVVERLSPIWPGRIEVDGENLGDVWRYTPISSTVEGSDLVPFHKLSQWLTYSLFEPLEEYGLRVVAQDALTGLPEYRNGGLFVDFGVLEPRDSSVTSARHEVGSPTIVEWRALTVALLDELSVSVRAQLGLTPIEFPLVKMLQGGTWSAGRRIAAHRRPGGGSPLSVESDGTVF